MNDYISEEDFLEHYGTPRHSGRYPWGSGENPYQHNEQFIRTVKKMKKDGVSETEIAKQLGYNSSTELRARYQAATNNNRKADVAYANKLKAKGMSNRAIGEKMGINESSVRSLLDPNRKNGSEEMDMIISKLKEATEKSGYVDVGDATELYLNVSKDKLEKALVLIKDEGFVVDNIHVEQAGNKGKYTDVRVLAKEGTTKKDIYDNMDKISTFADLTPSSDAGKKTNLGIYRPKSVDSKRVKIRYAEDGGEEKDGVIEIRRGVQDLSLGNSRYAQVRIAVDDTHYLKGMAVYSDNMPPGVDIIFNTNKKKGTPAMGPKDNTVLKPLEKKANGEVDWDNPFKAAIKADGQRMYVDKNGKEQLSPVNMLREEGEWDDWNSSHTLASQMLAKQPVQLAKRQLDISYKNSRDEFDEIMSNTNPTVKKYLLESFADECDSAATHLQAAGMPRQAAKVILPVTTLKENEIYAPSYRDGETVVLIRYPHGGRFEIPELTVNNRNKEAISRIPKDSVDAVGINKAVADRLSGADFDGDTVVVIPNNNGAIKTSKALEQLKDFDPKRDYPAIDGMKRMTKSNTQMEMGKVSNLITDMTIQGASQEELARAVKHSMVVIDAEKHGLNYVQSYKDQGIAELQKKYQPHEDDPSKGGGAYTLLSKASSPVYINKRQGSYRIDPNTGAKIWKESTETFTDKQGNEAHYKQQVDRMSIETNARNLSSGSLIEETYANYANSMKALANEARKSSLGLKLEYNPEAAKTYSKEVASLNAKLNDALKNSPKERQAQLRANVIAKDKIASIEDADKKTIKKIRGQSIVAARAQVGASKPYIAITNNEWKAIQAGAISDTKLKSILRNADDQQIKQLSTPRKTKTTSQSDIALAKSLSGAGYSLREIADRLGVSTTTVSNMINGKVG